MNNKNKIKWVIIIGIVLLIILFAVYFMFINKSEHFIGLSYEEVMNKVNDKEDFVLIVSRTNCSHCMDYKPKIKSVASQYGIDIYYTDIDLYSEEEKKKFDDDYSVNGTPATLFFEKGKETVMNRLEGDVGKSTIIATLKQHGYIK